MLLFNLVAATTSKIMNSSSLNRFFLILSLICVALGVVTGFWLLGSPQLQRQLKADQKRLEHLYKIASYLYREQSQTKKFKLPKTIPSKDYTVDPISGESYEYRVIDISKYKLCAEFATNSQKARQTDSSYRKLREFWNYSQGKNCFQFDAQEMPPSIYDYSGY